MTPAGYTVLPAIYDRWQATYGKDYSTLIFPRLLRTFRKFGIPASRLLDVACGTGSLALLLRPYGWRIRGVDGSAGMVRRAREKCRPFRPAISIGHQDMRDLQVRSRVNVCTCMFDSINHLTSQRDLHLTFRGVAQALNPGGWVIFDVNNEACYRTLWNGTQTLEHRDFSLRLENRYLPDRKIARSLVTVCWKTRSRRREEKEVVVERCFTRPELGKALALNGFQILDSDDFNFSEVPAMGALKTWWVARKDR